VNSEQKLELFNRIHECLKIINLAQNPSQLFKISPIINSIMQKFFEDFII